MREFCDKIDRNYKPLFHIDINFSIEEEFCYSFAIKEIFLIVLDDFDRVLNEL